MSAICGKDRLGLLFPLAGKVARGGNRDSGRVARIAKARPDHKEFSPLRSVEIRPVRYPTPPLRRLSCPRCVAPAKEPLWFACRFGEIVLELYILDRSIGY